jgi:hypothetical protein
MKRAWILVAATLAFSTAGADVYIKELNGQDSYFLGVKTKSAVESSNELWIGDNKLAYVTPGRTFIVDREAKTFCVVNTDSQTYVMMPLPVSLPDVLADDLASRYRERRRSGSVDATGKTAEMLGHEATEYEVVFWEVAGGEKSNEIAFRVWATTDVPFDWTPIDELMVPLRTVLNRDEALRAELLEIRGVQLRTEWDGGGQLGWKRKNFSKVVEISDREAPAGLYEAPAGFTRKDRLTGNDF